MRSLKKRELKAKNYSRQNNRKTAFSSPLALGLLAAVPAAKDPIDAILWHAGTLIIESGMTEPPYSPASYAVLRNVKQIIHRDMEVDGRLLPYSNGFVIELRKDRPQERKNFTCAHELAHTFFYESVPSIKYRTSHSTQPHHDKEEETLCNIAAAELLMPSSVFSRIAMDYPASPQSLQQLAKIFETSITATAVHLLRLHIWDSTFILWQGKHGELTAEWIAQPRRGLVYSPQLTINNPQSSSIYYTFVIGEATASQEWLCLNNGFKLCQVYSIRLNSKKVLSCVSHSYHRLTNTNIHKTDSPVLPLEYACECDGTGWRLIPREGRTYAARCRALYHKTYQVDS